MRKFARVFYASFTALALASSMARAEPLDGSAPASAPSKEEAAPSQSDDFSDAAIARAVGLWSKFLLTVDVAGTCGWTQHQEDKPQYQEAALKQVLVMLVRQGTLTDSQAREAFTKITSPETQTKLQKTAADLKAKGICEDADVKKKWDAYAAPVHPGQPGAGLSPSDNGTST